MLRTFRTNLLIAFAMVCMTSFTALADKDSVLGIVQNVDPQQERMIVKAGEETVVELRAPAKLLTGLQVGDSVEVTRVGQRVTLIRRLPGETRPELGGTLQFLPSDEP